MTPMGPASVAGRSRTSSVEGYALVTNSIEVSAFPHAATELAVAKTGQRHTRIDGPLKVCGLAEFPGDVSFAGMAHAALAVSAIARGQVTSIMRSAAQAMPGVLMILTHEEVGDAIGPINHLMEGGWANSSWRPLASPEIRYAGQIVAMVVAETAELATAAAAALRFSYAGHLPVTSLADPRCTTKPLFEVQAEHHDRRKGDLDAALAGAAVRIDTRYTTPIQHHNPIELPSRCCQSNAKRSLHDAPRSLSVCV